ncbi:tetratricopeptide repeat protein [Myxococcota bacterium]|nr:tetratricopeptide repeat protein [Myxococcota bacterium]
MDNLARINEALTPLDVLNRVKDLAKKREWHLVAALLKYLPSPLTLEWIGASDEIAFCLPRVQRWDDAASIYEQNHKLDPTWRRASALAYIYYDALWAQKNDRKNIIKRKRQEDQDNFERWINKALEHWPESVKDLYRLGQYESQIANEHDKQALQAFAQAIHYHEQKNGSDPTGKGYLDKTYVKALYGAARSAFRLRRYDDARSFIFRCIRVDKKSDYQEPLYKFFLAGKVCSAKEMDEDALRALRIAADKGGRKQHDFVYAELAKIELRRKNYQEALSWVENNIKAHQRKSYVWRVLGEVHLGQEDYKRAISAFENGLKKDRAGRHLTLCSKGLAELALGQLKAAKRSFQDSVEFKKKHYMNAHKPSLERLFEIAVKEGDELGQARWQKELQEVSSDDNRWNGEDETNGV